MNKNSFSMIDENGNETFYDVLFTFENDENGKNYIVYTDNEKDESGNIEVYASIYYPDDDTGRLDAIESDKEWKTIDTILQTLQEEIKKKANKDNNE